MMRWVLLLLLFCAGCEVKHTHQHYHKRLKRREPMPKGKPCKEVGYSPSQSWE